MAGAPRRRSRSCRVIRSSDSSVHNSPERSRRVSAQLSHGRCAGAAIDQATGVAAAGAMAKVISIWAYTVTVGSSLGSKAGIGP